MYSAKKIIQHYLLNYCGLSPELWQGILLMFVQSLIIGLCFFLAPYFANYLFFSVPEAGLIISCYGLGTICGGILGGKLSDIYSSRKVSLISFFVQSIAFIFLSNLVDKYFLMLDIFTIGTCAYVFITSNNTWLMQNTTNSETKLKTISISRAASNLGMGLAGVIIGFVDIKGFHILFYGCFLLLLLFSLYFYFFSKNNKINLLKKSSASSHTEAPFPYKIILILSTTFLIGLVISQLNVTYPIYIQQIFSNRGIWPVSVLFLLDTFLIVLFQAPLTNSIKNGNKFFLVGFGALLMGIGMFILNFSFIFIIAIISCLFWTIGEMIFISISQLVYFECGIKNKEGRAIGLFQTISATSTVIGPTIGSFIYFHYSPQVLWSLCLAIGILCFVFCNCYKKYDLGMNTNTTSCKRPIACEELT